MPLKPFAANDGTEKKIFLLKPRGFCAGVVRAIDVVEIALDLYGPPIYVRKEIVHNKHVVDGLREAGAIFVEELDEVPSGARAIFSAQRSPAEQRNELQDHRCRSAGHHTISASPVRSGATTSDLGRRDPQMRSAVAKSALSKRPVSSTIWILLSSFDRSRIAVNKRPADNRWWFSAHRISSLICGRRQDIAASQSNRQTAQAFAPCCRCRWLIIVTRAWWKFRKYGG